MGMAREKPSSSRRTCSFTSSLVLIICLLAVTLTLQGIAAEGPSESECRPLIEKALKEKLGVGSDTISTDSNENMGGQDESTEVTPDSGDKDVESTETQEDGDATESGTDKDDSFEEQAQADAPSTQDDSAEVTKENEDSTEEQIAGESETETEEDNQKSDEGKASDEDRASIESQKETESADATSAEANAGSIEGTTSTEEGTEESAISAEDVLSTETADEEQDSTKSEEETENKTKEDLDKSTETNEESSKDAEDVSKEDGEDAASTDDDTKIHDTASTEDGVPSAEKDATSAEEGTESADEGTASAEQGAASVEEEAASAEEGAASAEEGAASAEEEAASVEESAASVEEGGASIEEGPASAEENATSVEEGAVSAEESTASVEEGTISAEDTASAEGVPPSEGAASVEEGAESGEADAALVEGADSVEGAESLEEGTESVEVAASIEEGAASKEDAASIEGAPSTKDDEMSAEKETAEEELSKEEQKDADTIEEESKETDTENATSTETGMDSSEGAASIEELAEKSVEDTTEEEKDETAEETETEEVDETPEAELTQETLIPENLRPRDHLSELLHLDEESAETEVALAKAADVTLRELKRIYDTAIKPLEILYKYRDLSNRHFGDPEIFSKPLILFMGPWSGGKSSIINYLLDNEYNDTSLRTGAEPSPAYFNILMWGAEPEILDGTQLAADWTFSGLQKFGQGLEDRLRGLKLPNKLLEKVNIVEIPGILEVRKVVSRMFPFNDACQWFIDRADIIFLVYDPSKLDVGPETEAILDQLKGREYQTRIILNKADTVKPEELMRVQSALIWNISPLMSSPQPPVMYTTSLWSTPFTSGAPIRLLQAQERAFLRDLRQAVDKRVENKISSARRFAVRVRNHAKMVDCYLTTYYNHKSLFGNRKQIADEIIENPQQFHIYEGLSTLTNISRYDLPDPDVYKDFFKLNALYDFQPLSATCTYFRGCPINRLDVAIAYDLPELVGKHKKLAESATGKPISNS